MTTVVRTSVSRTPTAAMRRRRPCAFTLIELLVVIGIILILTAMTVPAVGPLLASNSMAQTVSTLNGLIATAQTAAEANFTTVGIRIERAFQTNDNNRMLDTTGTAIPAFTVDGIPTNGAQPAWLPHQQARFVIQGAHYGGGGGQYGFRTMANSRIVTLPEGAWLAPGHFLNWDYLNKDMHPMNDTAGYQSAVTNADANLANNRFSTFYILFNPEGELVRMGPTTTTPNDYVWYLDESAVQPSFVRSLDQSARSVVAYSRPTFMEQPSDYDIRMTSLRQQELSVYVNRMLGSTIGSTTP